MTKGRREERRYVRAGSAERDARHRAGGEWTTLEIPEGVGVFQPRDETYRFDIVPYLVKTGKETPGGNPYARAGTWYWERTFYVHKRVGPNGESWVCPFKTAGKRCPICEHRIAVTKDPRGNQDLVRSLAPQERQLFLVHLRGEEETKDVLLYECAYRKGFGEMLDRRRRKASEDEREKTDFDDPEAGAILVVEYEEETVSNKETGTSFKYIKPASIEFRPRKNGLDPEILEHGIDLDAVLKILPYEKLKSLYLQEDVEEEAPRHGGEGGGRFSESEEGVSRARGGSGREARVHAHRDEGELPHKDDREGEDDWPDKSRGSDLVQKTAGGRFVTASSAGIEVGMKVRTRKFGVCEVVRIAKNGLSVDVVDSSEEVHIGVPVGEVRVGSLRDGNEEEGGGSSSSAEEPNDDKDVDEEEDSWS